VKKNCCESGWAMQCDGREGGGANTLKTIKCGECTLNRNNFAAKAVPQRLCRECFTKQ
jgi:hypothetical protein